MPFIIALFRSPDLKFINCLVIYSGCCPAKLGLMAMALLPSPPWHAAQVTAAAWPLARSALAAAPSAANTETAPNINPNPTIIAHCLLMNCSLCLCLPNRTANFTRVQFLLATALFAHVPV